MPQEQIEEYLEAIFDIAGKDGIAKTTDVAKRLDKLSKRSSASHPIRAMPHAHGRRHTLPVHRGDQLGDHKGNIE